MNNQIAVTYTTVATEQDAQTLAKQVLTGKYAACVNILPLGKSNYWWEGKIEESAEYYLLFKTTLDKSAQLEFFILQNHPYTVPAILTSYHHTTQAFADYIDLSTR